MSEAGVDDVLRAAAQMLVVRGAPDDVEVAALVASLAAVASRDVEPATETAPRSEWNRPLRTAQGTRTSGADAWRWSLR